MKNNTITLDKHYKLKTDGVQWTLEYREPTGNVSEKTGKDTYKSWVKYYSGINQALKRYLDFKAGEVDGSIHDVIKAIQETHKTIENIKP